MPAPPNNRRGGGYVQIHDSASHGSPEHMRDCALLGQANEHLRRRICAKRIEGKDTKPSSRVYHWVLRMQGSLSRSGPWSQLTEKQRASIMKILNITELPPLPETKGSDVLKDLPKRPPHRRHEIE